MAERPILFQDEMVRAILDGRKTVTRRTGATWATVKPGDVLWVRECWAPGADGCHPVYFRASCPPIPGCKEAYLREGRWRPSIHMPQWACRLRLRVASVLRQSSTPFEEGALWMPDVTDAEARLEGFADREAFLAVWNKLHPSYAGVVYRVQFEVVK